MYSLNRAMIIGNATRDPEMRYTPNGQAVANFGVATNRKWKTQTGDMQEKTEFHDIVAWGKLAEIASQIIKKGGRVYVEGRLETRNWEAPDGAKRQKTEIIADNIIALSSRSEMGGAPMSGGSQAISSAPSTQSTSSGSQVTSNPHEGIDSAPKEDESQAPAEEASTPAKKEKEDKKTSDEDIDLNDIPF